MFRRGRAFQIKKPPETLQLTRARTRMHAERIAAFLSADCCHPCPPPLFPRPAPLPLPGPLFFCFLLAIMLFVVNGLHMRGGPLSSQLEAAGGTYVRDAQTVPQYTLHAIKPLAAAPPSLTHRGMPGLLYHPPCHHDHATASILVEVWDIPDSAIGGLLAGVPPPLAFGSIRLVATEGNGGAAEVLKGFICEGWVRGGGVREGVAMTDITEFGGWRAYMEQSGRK